MANTGIQGSFSSNVEYTGDNIIPVNNPVSAVDTRILLNGIKYNWDGAVWVKDPKATVLLTTQPTPTPSGNTTNLNTTFKDSTGATWFIDENGNALQMGVPVVLDGNNYSLNRLNATAGVVPTALEAPTPINGDTAIVFLTDGKVEYYAHNGISWTLIKTINPLQLDGNDRHVVRVNTITGVPPTILEVPAPILGDTAKVILTDGTVEYYSNNGIAWSLDATVTPASVHTVTYGMVNPPVVGVVVGQVYHQTSTGTNLGVLMNTWTWDGTTWFNESQPINVTRAQLITLRNASQLRQSQHYLVTDHVQGRLVAGTTILVHATADNEISENATVNTTYDNESWFGIYDADLAIVRQLIDNRNNTAKGFFGVEVANFDWGNTAYRDNVVDSATLTVTYGATALISNNTFEKASVTNLTGFTGGFNNNLVSTAANVNLTNANGTWRLSRFLDGGTFNASGYTGGGDNYYNTIWGASTINFSNTTSQIVFRQNEIHASTVNNTAVTSGTFTFNINRLQSATVTHSNSAGNFASTNGIFEAGTSINHSTGIMTLASVTNSGSTIQQGTNALATMNLSSVTVSEGSNVTNQSGTNLSMTSTVVEQVTTVNNMAGSAGSMVINYSTLGKASNIVKSSTATADLNISYSTIKESTTINQAGGAAISITRVEAINNSNITAQNGSGGALNVTDVFLQGQASITKLASSTAGTLAINGGTRIQSSSFIQTNGIGNISISQSTFEGASGVNITSGDRNYNIIRNSCINIGRLNFSGTGAAITDGIDRVSIKNNGSLNISCSGAANSLLFSTIDGLSASIVLSGTTGGKSIDRVKCFDGSLVVPNNPNAAAFVLFNISDAGIVTINNQVVGENIQYVYVSNGSSLTINKTGAGIIQYIQVLNNGTCNILGTTTSVIKALIEQGALVFNGGSANNISKKMQSTFTVNGGAQTSISHWTTINKATISNNNARVDYLGVVSTVPIV